MNTDEEHWQEVEALEISESTSYVGRAVIALATRLILIKGIPQ